MLVAGLSCAIWIYLLTARGHFWRARERDNALEVGRSALAPWPRVVAVIPARDEAATIGETVGSLLAQAYPGQFSVIVVDDHSIDGTAARARQASFTTGAADRLTVFTAPPLMEGWTGKLWAVNYGVQHAAALVDPPDYLLLSDADIAYASDTLAQLVVRARRNGLVLVSLMARLRCVSLAERAMIPAFVFFFQMLYPFAWVNSANRATAAAAGGCMLVSLKALQASGGFQAIRNELIDDCALALRLKQHGPIWLGLTQRARSLRAYRSLSEIHRMIARTAYSQLRFSPVLVVLTAAGMLVTYVVPVAWALLGSGTAQMLGLLGWALMALALQPTLRFYGVSPAWGVALPAIAALFLLFTLDSAYQAARGRGGLWKGRTHRHIPTG